MRWYDSPSPGGWAGYGAFGLSVPTPLPGQPGYAPDMKATGYNYCGSKYGMQQMLQDLGYYKGPIDGKVGGGTLGAMRAFSTASGVPIGSGSLSNAWCQALIDAWAAKMQPPAAPPPAQPPVGNGGQQPAPPAPNGNGPAPNGNGPVPNGNGNGVVKNGKGALDKAKDWWNSQSTGVKVAMGLGGVAIVGLIIYALVGGSKKATPNRRRYRRNKAPKRRLTSAQQTALGRIRGKRKGAKTGKIKTLKSGKRYGHLKPPKRYYKMGAKRPSDYADPEHYKYPLIFRGPSGKVNVKRTKAHIRSAQSYFAKHKRKYPMGTRRKIASSINKAKKRYGVGGKLVKA
jgi:hypothetical protein